MLLELDHAQVQAILDMRLEFEDDRYGIRRGHSLSQVGVDFGLSLGVLNNPAKDY